jgi:hypothetical protein
MRQLMGKHTSLNNSVNQYIERLNDLNHYLLCFSEGHTTQLNQDNIIEILDKAKAMDSK